MLTKQFLFPSPNLFSSPTIEVCDCSSPRIDFIFHVGLKGEATRRLMASNLLSLGAWSGNGFGPEKLEGLSLSSFTLLLMENVGM